MVLIYAYIMMMSGSRDAGTPVVHSDGRDVKSVKSIAGLVSNRLSRDEMLQHAEV